MAYTHKLFQADMNATSTPFDPAEMVKFMLDTILIEAPKQAAVFLWNEVLIPILSEHWLLIGALLFVVFLLVTIKAMLGRWGSLGSFLYNLLYFGTLFIVGFIWGPEVFVSNWLGFLTAVILYPVCYLAVGWILEKTGLK